MGALLLARSSLDMFNEPTDDRKKAPGPPIISPTINGWATRHKWMGHPSEQLRGENVDRRCDIFSLGVVAYELLTRKRPFAGDNISALIYSITQTTPTPPSVVDENIPGLFDMVVGRALAKDPLERYQSADQVAQDLKALAQEMTSSSYRI